MKPPAPQINALFMAALRVYRNLSRPDDQDAPPDRVSSHYLTRRRYLVPRIGEGALAARQRLILINHHPHQLLKGDGRPPAEHSPCLRRVTLEVVDLTGPEIAGVDL